MVAFWNALQHIIFLKQMDLPSLSSFSLKRNCYQVLGLISRQFQHSAVPFSPHPKLKVELASDMLLGEGVLVETTAVAFQ